MYKYPGKKELWYGTVLCIISCIGIVVQGSGGAGVPCPQPPPTVPTAGTPGTPKCVARTRDYYRSSGRCAGLANLRQP